MTDRQAPTALAARVTDKDPAVGLRAVLELRRLLEELERLHVDNARAEGWSWQGIAEALQVSRQSVHEKHAARRRVTGLEKPHD
jgi:gentisate 1,2-dioxygenase